MRTHALPALHTEAMAKLDAILGRGPDAAPARPAIRAPKKGSPAPIEANEGPDPRSDRAELVPHTGIAANVRRVPAEYGCYIWLRPAPAGPDWLEGTNEGVDRRQMTMCLSAHRAQ